MSETMLTLFRCSSPDLAPLVPCAGPVAMTSASANGEMY